MWGDFPYVAPARERGYAMAALLVALGLMGIVMSMALPVWTQAAKREREAELIFRGEQYARAVELYQRRYVGAYPPNLDTLVEQRFLRRVYQDPMTPDGEFRVVYQGQVTQLEGEGAVRPGESADEGRESRGQIVPVTGDPRGDQGGVVGVVSRSEEPSLRIYNGRRKYSEWAFIYMPSESGTNTRDDSDEPGRSRRDASGTPRGENRGRFDSGGDRSPSADGLRGDRPRTSGGSEGGRPAVPSR